MFFNSNAIIPIIDAIDTIIANTIPNIPELFSSMTISFSFGVFDKFISRLSVLISITKYEPSYVDLYT